MEEAQYRKEIAVVFDRIEKAFDDVDPDKAECRKNSGVLSIKFDTGGVLVLNAQPALKQLWLADSAGAKAYRFGMIGGDRWIDTKDGKTELYSLLNSIIGEVVGISI
jgi:iron donor protein CyaY